MSANTEKISELMSGHEFTEEYNDLGYMEQTAWEMKKISSNDLIRSLWPTVLNYNADVFEDEWSFDCWGLNEDAGKMFLQLDAKTIETVNCSSRKYEIRIFKKNKKQYDIAKCELYKINPHDFDK